jgi:hypothetical protein
MTAPIGAVDKCDDTSYIHLTCTWKVLKGHMIVI